MGAWLAGSGGAASGGSEAAAEHAIGGIDAPGATGRRPAEAEQRDRTSGEGEDVDGAELSLPTLPTLSGARRKN